MSNSRKGWESLKRLRNLTEPADLEQIERDVGREMMYRGGSPSDMEDGDNNPEERTDRWRTDIDGRVTDNTKTARENKKLLAVVDERTSIMMKIMVATLITFIVTVAGGMVIAAVEVAIM